MKVVEEVEVNHVVYGSKEIHAIYFHLSDVLCSIRLERTRFEE